MFDQVLAALSQQQLTQAAQLLKQWQRNNPQDPWLQLATGQYWEAKGELEKAQITYTRLLQSAANTRVISQAREGVQRVRDQLAQRREHDLKAAKHRPEAQGAAVLVLEAVAGSARNMAAQGLATVMQLDVYTARMRLPSQNWRLFRVGPAGELQYFSEQLQAHNTPAFAASVAQVKALPVFRVLAIKAFEPQVTVLCQNNKGQKGTIQLTWADVTQWVVGLLPLYESVVDLDPRGKLMRREATQDYAEVMDWHLHGRGCVLRFCDRTYKYRDSAPLLTSTTPLVAATAWKALKDYGRTSIQSPPHADFAGFGAGALDFIDLLPDLDPHIGLAREWPSPWDAAFHLYSSLRFLHYRPGP